MTGSQQPQSSGPRDWEYPQGWQKIQAQQQQPWQGQLGPNLMPLAGPEVQPMASAMNIDMQSRLLGDNFSQGHAEVARPQFDSAQLQGSSLPGMHNMQSMPNFMDLPHAHVLQEPARQLMQMITLPVGVAPPLGAIPMNTAPVENTPNVLDLPGARVPQEPMRHMMQVITLPVGAAPPEGAIPMGPAPAEAADTNYDASSEGASSQSEPSSPSKAFKIKDPRTGRVVRPPGEEAAAAPRRLRIVNPKTGQEVRPCL